MKRSHPKSTLPTFMSLFVTVNTLIRFELLLKQWANEPLQVPEEATVLQCPPLVIDEVKSKWSSLDAALELLRMKIRTSR